MKISVFSAILALAVFAYTPSALEAQEQFTFTTFTQGRVTREQYASAIGSSDREVLKAPSDSIVDAANRTFGINLDSKGWADFMRQMEVAPCLEGGDTTTLLRVHRIREVVDMNGRSRPLRNGEMCLWSDNRAFFSLDCGNITPNLYRHVEAKVGRRVARVPSIDRRLVYRREKTDTSTSTANVPTEQSFLDKHGGHILTGVVIGAVGGVVWALLASRKNGSACAGNFCTN